MDSQSRIYHSIVKIGSMDATIAPCHKVLMGKFKIVPTLSVTNTKDPTVLVIFKTNKAISLKYP